jgi:exonuclease SbcC
LKLLKIKLENLNSLYGKHCVDFQKDLMGAPLFLIVGPTGAGKSTLMDAISLALFGQTPRLTKGKSEKDHESDCRQMMSRGTFFAFAQLTFSKWERGEQKSYRATWQCERAYKKPDGNLKDPRRILEIYNEQTQKWEELVSDYRPKFYEPYFTHVLENLSAEDFKRMVLLAQGEFAAFLNATEDDRAIILERLTNTEKYKEIGKRASIQKKCFEDKLIQTRFKLNGVHLLSKEEEEILLKEKDKIHCDLILIKDRISFLEKEIIWFHEELELFSKLQEAEKKWDVFEIEYKKNEDIIKKFECFNKFKKAIDYIKECEAQKKNLVILDELISKLRLEIKEKKNSFICLTESLNQEILEYENLKNEFFLKKQNIEKAKFLILQKKSLLEEVLFKNEHIEIKNKDKNNKKIVLIDIEEKISYEKKEKSKIFKNIKMNYYKYYKNYANFLKDFEKKNLEFQTLRNSLIAISLPYKKPQEKLANYFDEKDRLNSSSQELLQVIFYLENIKDKEQELFLLEQKLLKNEELYEEFQKSFLLKKSEIFIQEGEIFSLKKELEIFNWKVQIINNRNLLNIDDECPLCGSLSHPFILNEVYKMKDMEFLKKQRSLVLNLNNCQILLEEKKGQFKKLEKVFFLKEKEVSETRLQIKELKKILDQKNFFIKENFSYKFPFLLEKNISESFLEKVLFIKKENEKNIFELEEKIKKISKDIFLYNDLKEDHFLYKEKNEKFLLKIKKIKSFILKLDPFFCFEELNFEEKEEKEEKYSEIFLKDFDFEENLLLKEDFILGHENKKLILRKELFIIEENILEIESEKKKLEKNLINIEKEILNLVSDKDPFFLEKELKENLSEKENKIKKIENFSQNEKITLEILKEKLKNNFDKKNDLNKSIFFIESLISEEIKGFSNTKEIISYDLSEEDYVNSKNIFLNFENLKTSLLENKKLREYDLNQHKFRKNFVSSGKKLEELIQEKKILTEKYDLQIKKNGKNEACLLSHQENKEKYSLYLEEVKRIENEYSVWQRLHQIIGINNGDEFKKFAQILNLEDLIEKANFYLERFNKRYSLALALNFEGSPRLAFAIQDSYHADVLRSFKTLSGGETFLVSLALALALADYRSVKMPIETILLDEGFGTLDSLTLQTALGALESLYSCGTQVGIISHVEALKDAIGVRIVVEKLGNGHSRIRVET